MAAVRFSQENARKAAAVRFSQSGDFRRGREENRETEKMAGWVAGGTEATVLLFSSRSAARRGVKSGG